ncbi:MAG: hypothetical protein HY675_16040 [Chloroflexi bacterium]|nr:hypothetical protein [Chloroflexota bacterium]
MALTIGLVSAILFVTLSSVRLTAQGLYYDELHQATASFAYKGTSPEMFSTYAINGIPVLNMPYSGALKTAVYGLYLKFSGASFSVPSWRLLGILFVSLGLLLFCVIARRGLPFAAMLAFLLILTDTTVVLASRHDWGPVALALLLRLLFVAIWIRGEAGGSPSAKNTFSLGVLFGLSVFEKISSLILILPLALMLSLTGSRRSPRHAVAVAGGLVAGASPLIYVNLDTLFRTGSLISFNGPPVAFTGSLSGFVKYVSEYLTLGNGSLLSSFILGRTVPGLYSQMEGPLVGALLLLVAAIGILRWKSNRLLRLSAVVLVSYLVVGIGIFLSPVPTWVHHWITGTPFQYAAISLAVAGLFGVSQRLDPRDQLLRVAIMALVSSLVVARLIGVASVEDSLARGEASLDWDPSLTEVGLFAAQRADEAIFIAADWGVATQIYSLSDGQPGLVYQLVWNYKGPKDLQRIAESAGKDSLYVVAKKPRSPVNPEVTGRILRDIVELPGWQEMPVENEIADLRAVEVRKFSPIPSNPRNVQKDPFHAVQEREAR